MKFGLPVFYHSAFQIGPNGPDSKKIITLVKKIDFVKLFQNWNMAVLIFLQCARCVQTCRSCCGDSKKTINTVNHQPKDGPCKEKYIFKTYLKARSFTVITYICTYQKLYNLLRTDIVDITSL